jgi:hypothetical protein
MCCELDVLQSAISDAIKALAAWDIAAFESAVERQDAICGHLTSASNGWGRTPDVAEAAHTVQRLNRVYDRLLQHSAQWTRTVGAILQAGGHQPTGCASVHFRA